MRLNEELESYSPFQASKPQIVGADIGAVVITFAPFELPKKFG